MSPDAGISVGLTILRISSNELRSGDCVYVAGLTIEEASIDNAILTIPPCIHRIRSLTNPAGGKQLKVSENNFQTFILYLRLPLMTDSALATPIKPSVSRRSYLHSSKKPYLPLTPALSWLPLKGKKFSGYLILFVAGSHKYTS
jgi:hypothetical protein